MPTDFWSEIHRFLFNDLNGATVSFFLACRKYSFGFVIKKGSTVKLVSANAYFRQSSKTEPPNDT